MGGNESWVWIRDSQVFETEVQMIMDLIGRKVKIWERISSGKYPHRIDFLLSDIAPDFKARKNQRRQEGEACVLVKCLWSAGNNLGLDS